MSEFKPCKICGCVVSWCSYSECDGCHRIVCKDCKAQFDLIDCISNPNAETLKELREQIAEFWNTRATPIAEIIDEVQALKIDDYYASVYPRQGAFNMAIDQVIVLLERYI